MSNKPTELPVWWMAQDHALAVKYGDLHSGPRSTEQQIMKISDAFPNLYGKISAEYY